MAAGGTKTNFFQALACFNVQKERSAVFESIAALLSSETKLEEDCLFYNFSFDENNTVWCVEGYRNAEAFQLHLSRVDHLIKHALTVATLPTFIVVGNSAELKECQDVCTKLNAKTYQHVDGTFYSTPFNHISIVSIFRPKTGFSKEKVIDALSQVCGVEEKFRYCYSGFAQNTRNEFLLRQGFPDGESVHTYFDFMSTQLEHLRSVANTETIYFHGSKIDWELAKPFLEGQPAQFFEFKLPPQEIQRNVDQIRTQMQSYTNTKNIGEVLSALVHNLLAEKPDDPVTYMEKWLAERDSSENVQ